MQHQDLARTGANLDETVLDVAAVGSGRFGRLGAYAVDGQIYAQPLYVPDLDTDRGRFDIVLAATEHGTLYAFDANDIGSEPRWQAPMGTPFPIGKIYPACVDLTPEIGITSTPAIDRQSGTVFVTSKHLEDGKALYRLHAIELATGRERAGSPIVVAGSVPGTADDAVGGVLAFDAMRHLQRPAITLANGVLWLGFGSHCDYGPYHGWVFAYDATTLAPRGVFCVSPDDDSGGVWQAGQGFSADERGDVYFMTGNGAFDGKRAWGSSFLRLRAGASGIEVVTSFTPYNHETLSDTDYDLGSAGVLLVPGTGRVLGGGKEGRLYVLDRDAMGGFDPDRDRVLQSIQATRRPTASHIHGSPVFWRGPDRDHVYVWGESDALRDFGSRGGTLSETPLVVGRVNVPEGMPGAILTLSSDGTRAGSAVVWASHPSVENMGGERIVAGTLRAFDAMNVGTQLWSSEQKPEDALGLHPKFAAPTVADGRLFVATFSNALVVYGLR